MTFDQALQEKWERGRREHGEDWQSVDWRKEAQGELCDLWYYISLSDDEVLKARVQLWCRDVWTEIEDLGDFPPR